MAENKTQMNDTSVNAFIDSVADEQKRADSRALVALMTRVTGQPPKMWGDSIIGFGHIHYKYATGREGDMPATGFSPRKQAMTVYLWYGFEEDQELMRQLGKHKVGKACLYFKKLEDIDQGVLEKLIEKTIAQGFINPA
ncbi:MAG: DUF1801 domain-containing protein [Anaerolineaceae bacterium]|nr:DUF1801 domain-containing protein [Anaerolineaceae bacterium]